jgi:hypothetical protein
MSTVGFSKSNSTIKNGVILKSIIDMNGSVITSHGTPVADTDVPNKAYVDASSSSGIPSLNITLSSTSWTSVSVLETGDFTVSIKNMVSGGPSGNFLLTKNESSRQASIIRNSSSAGLTTEERLEMIWPINDGIYLRKNKTGYDGTYQIKYISND